MKKSDNMFLRAYSLWKEIRHSGRDGLSMRIRLFAFLAFLLFSVLMLFLLLLLMAGVFNNGSKTSRLFLENELSHLKQDIDSDYGKLTLQGLSLSQEISGNMELTLRKQGILPSELAEHPEQLEALLSSQVTLLSSYLKNTKSSGAFLILDATVNPALENAASSRAGIFLKSAEPNIVNAMDANIRYLRGPAECAREHGLQLLPQWKQEFRIEKEDFYSKTIQTAKSTDIPLSRLYYWSRRTTLDGNSESAMLLCLPLISHDGTVFGVCGLEISSMLFKLAYSPDNSVYPRVFSSLLPSVNDYVNINGGLIAGNYYMTNYLGEENIAIHKNRQDFNTYYSANGTVYGGLQEAVSLYPSDSAFSQEKWILSVMMPYEDLENAIRGNNSLLFVSLAALLIAGILAAFFISKHYIDPVIHAIHLIKTGNTSEIEKTRYLEIDDLLEYMNTQTASTEPIDANLSSYEEFVRNIQTLSAAERAVFNLYMEGHTAQEIADILCLSMNTIKTHNKRIYMKLNVSSRKELMVYVQMMTQHP